CSNWHTTFSAGVVRLSPRILKPSSSRTPRWLGPQASTSSSLRAGRRRHRDWSSLQPVNHGNGPCSKARPISCDADVLDGAVGVVSSQAGDGDVGPSHRAIASNAGAEGAGADPRRNGDDYPMTSIS